MKNLLLVTAFLCMLCSTSLNAQWASVNAGTTDDLYAVDYTNAGSVVWLGGFSGTSYSSNSGTSYTWKPALDLTIGAGWIVAGSIEDLHAFNATTAVSTGVINLGNDEQLLKSVNSGAGWTEQYINSSGGLPRYFTAFAFRDATNGIVVGANGRIMSTADAGTTWINRTSNTTSLINDVKYIGGTTYVAVGQNVTLRSTDNGVTWNPSAAGEILTSCSFSGNTGYMGGQSGGFYKTTNGGVNWTAVSAPGGQINAVYTVSADTVFAATINDLYKSTDGGLYWQHFKLTNYQDIAEIDFADKNNGMCVGDNGYAIRTTNGGGLPYPVPLFDLPSLTVCTGTPVSFTNHSDPAHTYLWSFGAAGTSVATNPTVTFSTAGTYNISLVCTSPGGMKDTLIQQLTVLAAADVNPFAVNAVSDSVCNNTTATLQVLSSQAGVTYRLRNGQTQVGTSQNGNGSTLTFTTPSLTVTQNYNIIGQQSNVCSSDSFVVNQTITVVHPSVLTTFTESRDTICRNDTASIIIFNTEPGFKYNWAASPSLTNPFTDVQGTGGTIVLQIPALTSTRTFSVRSTHTATGCVENLSGTQQVIVVNPTATVVVSPIPALTGQPVTFTNTSVFYNIFTWDFGPGATPSTYTGFNPPPVTYSSAFTGNVNYTAVLSDSICYTSNIIPIEVVTAAVTIPVTSCLNSDSISGSTLISDMYLDKFNAKYITGQRYVSGLYNEEVFAAKIDSTGKVIWQLNEPDVDANDDNRGLSVIADDYGNAYVSVSSASNLLEINGYRFYEKNILLSFDRNGNVRWAMTSQDAFWSDMARDQNGRMYIAGRMPTGIANVQGGDGGYISWNKAGSDTTSGGTFIMEFDRNGKIVQFTPFGRSRSGTLTGVESLNSIKLEADASGNLVIAGLMQGFQSGEHYYGNIHAVNNTTGGSEDAVFAAKFNTQTNTITSAASVIGSISAGITAMTTDDSGYVFISIYAHDLLYRSDTLQTLVQGVGGNNGPLYNVLLKTNDAGDLIWYTHTRYGYYRDMEIVDDSLLMVLGTIKNNGSFSDANFSSFGLNSGSASDIALIKYTVNGDLRSINQTGGSQFDWPHAMCKDLCGNIHTAESRNQPNFCYPDLLCASVPNTSPLHFYVYGRTSCGGNCYSGYDPSRKDLQADSLYVDNILPVFAGQRNVYLRIKNTSQIPVTSAQLAYKINNGTTQTVAWNGTLSYGDTTSVLLFTSLFNSGVYFSIHGWINTVNATADADLQNDSASASLIRCQSPLSGTYSLGTIASDFETFGASTEALKTCGINGAVYFDVASGHYSEQIVVPALATNSLNDSVTWRSASGDSSSVIIDYRLGKGFRPSVVAMENYARNFCISSMTFEHTAATSADNNIIFFNDSCSNITIKNCSFKGITGNNTQQLILLPNLFKNDSIRFLNNRFDGGAIGIHHMGCIATTPELYDQGSVISGNYFTRQYTVAIKMSWMNKPVVSDNRIYKDTLDTQLGGVALNMDAVKSPLISNNIVHTLNLTAQNVPFVLSTITSTPAEPGLFVNNILLNHSRGAFAGLYGVQLASATNFHMYYNTLDAPVLLYSGNTTLTLRNNAFRQSQLAIYGGTLANIVSSDYNSFSHDPTANANLFYINSVAYTYSSWKAITGFDAHSLNQDLTFANWSDYHVGGTVNPRGTPIAGFDEDIDGQQRSAVIPFIGADELDNFSDVWPGDANNDNVVNNFDILPVGLFFNTFGNPRTLVSNTWQGWSCNDWGRALNGKNQKYADCDGSGTVDFDDTLAINYQNYGLTHRQSAPVASTFVGGAPDLYLTLTEPNLLPGDTAEFILYAGSLSVPVNDIYNVACDINVGQQVIDPAWSQVSFDSCWIAVAGQRIQTSQVDAGSGTISIGVSRISQPDTSGYGEIARIRFVLANSFVVPSDIYTSFTTYQAYNEAGIPVVFNAQQDTLHVGPVGINENESDNFFLLSPNPADDHIRLVLSQSVDNGRFIISDVSGRQIYTEALVAGTTSLLIPCNQLAAGTYSLQLITKDRSYNRVFIKQ